MSVYKLANRKLSTGKPWRNDVGELTGSGKPKRLNYGRVFTMLCYQHLLLNVNPFPGVFRVHQMTGYLVIAWRLRKLTGWDNISPGLLTADRTTKPFISAHQSLAGEVSEGVIINRSTNGDLTNWRSLRDITVLCIYFKQKALDKTVPITQKWANWLSIRKILSWPSEHS